MTDYTPPEFTPTIDPIPATQITVVEPLPATNEAPPIATPLLGERLPSNEPQIKPARLLSLDVFRGITLATMTVVNNNAGEPYGPLDHAPWGKGWTPTDLVFPFFLFIVGVAIPFSLGKRSTIGQPKSRLLGSIWLRSLSLFMVGQLLQGNSNFHQWDTLPPGFHVLPVVRWIGVIFCYVSILALLIPWRPSRRAWMLPVGICISFYLLCGIVGLINSNAIKHGLTINVGGMLKPGSMRIPGILQRIGFCYGVAATIMLYAGWRTALLTSIATCFIYLCLMFYAPFHDPATGKAFTGTISEEHNFARAVDETVFDKYTVGATGEKEYQWRHAYNNYPDNEGLVSTLPAIANALIGAMAGLWLRTLRPSGERCAGLFVFGVLAILIGYFLDAHSIPINKTIWTPAYAVFSAGLALVGLGIVYFIVDINGYRKWSWPFVVLGMNSIAVFVANNWVFRVNHMFDVPTPYRGAVWNETTRDHVLLGSGWVIAATGAVHQAGDWFHQHISPSIAGVQSHFSPHGSLIVNEANTSLAYALSFLIVIWLLMLILYVCKIFVKI